VKKEKMLEHMRGDIARWEARRDEAQAKMEHWSLQLTEAEQELSRLQVAKDALEGAVIHLRGPEQNHKFPLSTPLEDGATILRQIPQTGKEATLNGEKIVLEPGFKIARNSFGEESIVPESMEVVPMAEPDKPNTLSLTAPGDDFAPDEP
jgi:hypothetical protein